MKSCKEFWTRERLIGLALGQFLSILIALTGFLASKLAKKEINASTAQSFLNYVLLAIVYGSIILYRRKKTKTETETETKTKTKTKTKTQTQTQTQTETQDPSICSSICCLCSRIRCLCSIGFSIVLYAVLGFVDVEANFLFVEAYKYTTATRIMLYDAWSVPSVMILIWINFKSKDKFQKITGALICIAGLVTVYFSAINSKDRNAKEASAVKGAIFTFVGTTLHSVSNVIEEYKVNQDGRIKCMSMLGVFGAIIGAIQVAVFERDNLNSINWRTSEATLPFIGFSVALFLFYSLVPMMLKNYGSIMLNLSLLTSSMWTAAFDGFHSQKVDWLYFLAFGTVLVGLIIYSGTAKDDEKRNIDETKRARCFNLLNWCFCGCLGCFGCPKEDA